MEGTEGTTLELCHLRPAGAHQAQLLSAGKTGRPDWKGSRMLRCCAAAALEVVRNRGAEAMW